MSCSDITQYYCALNELLGMYLDGQYGLTAADYYVQRTLMHHIRHEGI